MLRSTVHGCRKRPWKTTTANISRSLHCSNYVASYCPESCHAFRNPLRKTSTVKIWRPNFSGFPVASAWLDTMKLMFLRMQHGRVHPLKGKTVDSNQAKKAYTRFSLCVSSGSAKWRLCALMWFHLYGSLVTKDGVWPFTALFLVQRNRKQQTLFVVVYRRWAPRTHTCNP